MIIPLLNLIFFCLNGVLRLFFALLITLCMLPAQWWAFRWILGGKMACFEWEIPMFETTVGWGNIYRHFRIWVYVEDSEHCEKVRQDYHNKVWEQHRGRVSVVNTHGFTFEPPEKIGADLNW